MNIWDGKECCFWRQILDGLQLEKFNIIPLEEAYSREFASFLQMESEGSVNDSFLTHLLDLKLWANSDPQIWGQNMKI